jgi:hypothetical protein
MKQRNLRLLLAATVLSASCGYPGPPKPPSLNLPQPVSDLQAVRKGNTVYLTWTVPTETTDSLPLRHLGRTRICRNPGVSINDCANPLGEVSKPILPVESSTRPPQRLNFTDSMSTIISDDPASQISYAVSVLNDRGRSAGTSNVVTVPALAAASPPIDLRAEVTANGVILRWTPIPSQEAPDVTRRYRVYRRAGNNNADTIVGEAPLDSSQLVDQSFEWQRTYFYRETLVTTINLPGKAERQFESEDTPPVKVFAHDIFPPAVPSGLQAAFSGEGQKNFIDLIWAPDTDADLAGYNLYRHEDGKSPEKINSQPIKTPSFQDTSVTPGGRYVYSVSAIDVRGNESAHSTEASEAVPER